MFAKSSSPRAMPLGSKTGIFSLVGQDMAVRGDITATADLHIDGQVTGDVACAALVLGRDSRIAGAIVAESARIAGRIDGSVRATTLIIEAGAHIAGDVEYGTITIETGGHVDGRLTRIEAVGDGPMRLISSSAEAA